MSINPFPIRVQISSENLGEPDVFDSKDGLFYDSPKYCKDNCDKSACRDEYKNLEFQKGKPHFKICHKGFLICSYLVYNKKYVIHGVIDSLDKEKNRNIFGKKYIPINVAEKEKIEKFIAAINELDKSYYKSILAKTNQLIMPYHDIKRLVGTIVSNIENYAKRSKPDMKVNEAVFELDEKLKAIFFTSKLIDSYTSVVDAFSNPAALKTGATRTRGVYKSFDKMSKILESRALSKKITIVFNGTDFTEIPAYSSLDLLPFILIDNAIKYSSEGYEIVIYFTSLDDELIVKVENTGCYITDEDKKNIFKRFNRGKYASAFSSEGSGIGLFLAKAIAEHHNAVIEVDSQLLSYQQRGIEIAVNSFTLRFKT